MASKGYTLSGPARPSRLIPRVPAEISRRPNAGSAGSRAPPLLRRTKAGGMHKDRGQERGAKKEGGGWSIATRS
eukprot:984522-Pyramimonas_sp.AAC.1